MQYDQAVRLAEQGKKIRRALWVPFENEDSSGYPSYLVFVPGRTIEASYSPMVEHLGKGTLFQVHDHMDAVYLNDRTLAAIGDKNGPKIALWLNYPVSAMERGADDWEVVA
jgi:hypothetical protein